MACRLAAVSFDSADPLWLARFWGELLGWRLAGGPSDCATLVPGDGVRFWFQFRIAPAQDPGRNERHLPLTSSSAEDQRQTLAKALGLGAHPLDVGQRPEEGHVVLADPEGNEFCVIEPGNKYLADCGFLAKITCAGSRQVGSFWSEVLAWPLVWDQGLQTAIQSPQGGPKVSCDEEGVPTAWRNRLRFVITPVGDGDPQAEADRLVALGAREVGRSEDRVAIMAMADPDGCEFYLQKAR